MLRSKFDPGSWSKTVVCPRASVCDSVNPWGLNRYVVGLPRGSVTVVPVTAVPANW